MINVSVAVLFYHTSKAAPWGIRGRILRRESTGGRMQLSAFHELNSISCIAGRKEVFRMAQPLPGIE